ncbi:chromosome partition protein Smc [Shewanella sp. NFH-SH190041]|nr:chromosome partition protein Smc [Shewanella sp. NFH-SH190041]
MLPALLKLPAKILWLHRSDFTLTAYPEPPHSAMRLKQIKLAGFKSFVDATKIPFLKPLTAIIGPNGCGKSNTIDAVRWVLGESSAKHLRGDAMTDVIFNGSTARRPVSVASVELVFENLDGRLSGQYAAYNEISVKRQVNRDAESSYFLNGQKCRRKDITDLFMGTGLGPRSYAIIEQGTISRLIDSKPHELRVFIEEAAGISRYKERRRDTENRIRHTRENLERLGDIRLELGKQLDKLSEQAKSAKRYREFKQQERQTQAELLVMRYQELMQQADTLNQQLDEQSLQLAKVQAAKEEVGSQQTAQQVRLEALERQEQQLVQVYYQTGTEIARLEQQLSHEQQKDANTQKALIRLNSQRDSIVSELNQLSERLIQLQAEQSQLATEAEGLAEIQDELTLKLEQLEAEKQLLDERCQNSKQQMTELKLQQALAQSQQQHLTERRQLQQKALAQLQQAALNAVSTERLDAAQSALVQCQNNQQTAQAQYQQCERHTDELRQQKQQLSTELATLDNDLAANYSRQELISHWLDKAAGDENTPKLWQQITVTPGWEAATELLLDGLLNMPVVANDSLSGFYPCGMATQHSMLSAPVNLAPWLERVQLAQTKAEGLARQASLADDERIITADGYLIGRGFVLQKQGSDTAVVSLQHELQTLQELTAALQDKHQGLASQLSALQQLLTEQEQQLSSVRQQLDNATLALAKAEQHLSGEQQRLDEACLRNTDDQQRQQQLMDELSVLATELELQQEKTAQLDEQLCHSQEDNAALDLQQQQQVSLLKEVKSQQAEQLRRSNELTRRLAEIDTQSMLARQQQAQLKERLAELARSESELNRQPAGEDPAAAVGLAQLEQQLAALLTRQGEQQHQLSQLRAEQTQLQAELESTLLKQKQEVGKIETVVQAIGTLKLQREGIKGQADSQMQLLTEAGIKLTEVAAGLAAGANSDLWQKNLDTLRGKISRLGAINLAAIEEYEQQSERKSYLDSQDEDLNKALQSLEEAIRKIDRETRSRFKATFDQINTDLGNLFPKVFGGGSAYLALTDDDLLETGVSIMARPPGKKNSTIQLLSGGEKALTALSLVFAIFRLNPAPFCMLDEVDAPLDDANVERFCRLLKEMSQTVQFIYISHNKITMEMADQLIGVTMHEPGVSRIVAVDLEEAVAMADAG